MVLYGCTQRIMDLYHDIIITYTMSSHLYHIFITTTGLNDQLHIHQAKRNKIMAHGQKVHNFPQNFLVEICEKFPIYSNC